jgi:tripartite motif-containing protein 71
MGSRPIRIALIVAGLAAALLVPAAAEAEVTPLSMFGSAGTGAGQLNQPTGIATDASGTVYVADKYSHRISEFTEGGAFIRTFGWGVQDGTAAFQVCSSGCQIGLAGGGAGQLSHPTGIARGPDGNLYVGDRDNPRISVFTPGGAFLRAFGWGVATGAGALEVCTATCLPGAAGGGTGQIQQPRGVAVDPNGNVFIADEDANRVEEFTSTGAFVQAFGWGVLGGAGFETCASGCTVGVAGGGAGQVAYPRGIAADASTVYVADSGNNRVSEFTTGGSFLRAFGWGVATGASALEVCTSTCQTGLADGGAGQLSTPYSIALDGTGSLYVGEIFSHRVDEFTSAGSFVRGFGWGVASGAGAFEVCTLTCQDGSAGAGMGQINQAEGVAVDCRGAVVVIDRPNSRVERFGEPGTKTVPPCNDPAAPGPTGRRAAALKKCKKKHSKKKRKRCRKRARKLPV